MRNFAVLVIGLGLVTSAPSAWAMVPGAGASAFAPTGERAVTRVGYFCSPGFVASYGGRCIATEGRDEVELFVNEPVEAPAPVYRHHHRRHALHDRY